MITELHHFTVLSIIMKNTIFILRVIILGTMLLTGRDFGFSKISDQPCGPSTLRDCKHRFATPNGTM